MELVMNESALTNRPAQQETPSSEDLPLFEHNADATRDAADAVLPKLTLVHSDEFDVDDFEGTPAQAGAFVVDEAIAPASEAAADQWPWVKEDTLDIIRDDSADQFEGPDPVQSSPAANASVNESVIDDLSAVEDVVLSNPLAESHQVDAPADLPEVAIETSTPTAFTTTASAPRTIGSGRLVPARLTWKPGDPFAGVVSDVPHHFRWELMLTAACITSVCGLGCIWLLRTLLA
jgi:hypothetical protein